MNAPYQNTVHYSELADLPADDPLAIELAAYKREAGRLIAEGHEGRFVLIKNGVVIGIWDNWHDAIVAGEARFGVREPFMVHQILTRERVYRLRCA